MAIGRPKFASPKNNLHQQRNFKRWGKIMALEGRKLVRGSVLHNPASDFDLTTTIGGERDQLTKKIQ